MLAISRTLCAIQQYKFHCYSYISSGNEIIFMIRFAFRDSLF